MNTLKSRKNSVVLPQHKHAYKYRTERSNVIQDKVKAPRMDDSNYQL